MTSLSYKNRKRMLRCGGWSLKTIQTSNLLLGLPPLSLCWTNRTRTAPRTARPRSCTRRTSANMRSGCPLSWNRAGVTVDLRPPPTPPTVWTLSSCKSREQWEGKQLIFYKTYQNINTHHAPTSLSPHQFPSYIHLFCMVECCCTVNFPPVTQNHLPGQMAPSLK